MQTLHAFKAPTGTSIPCRSGTVLGILLCSRPKPASLHLLHACQLFGYVRMEAKALENPAPMNVPLWHQMLDWNSSSPGRRSIKSMMRQRDEDMCRITEAGLWPCMLA